MKLRQSRREEPEINLIPLIDVMLFLLIFFVVTTTFTRNSGITLNLPEASPRPVEEREAPIEIVVDAQGRYYVNDQLVVNKQIETLKKALQLATQGKDHPALVISADANATHQSVVSALDAALQLGLVQVSMTTRQPEGARP
ncbi:MAG: biopolymer transporter ExbD [Gammaproteobacteria bacterium]|nr:biopolymer transporter ExbD [Gammaproteobacteria bacterium]